MGWRKLLLRKVHSITFLIDTGHLYIGNVLCSQVDLLPMYGPLPFKLDFFTECMNLAPLLR